MVNRCVVFGCGNEPSRGISLHEFPKTNTRRSTWKRFVDRTRKNWDGPTNVSAICSAHFEDGCFLNKTQYDMGFAKKLELRDDATPTIYPTGTCRTQAKGAASEPLRTKTSAMRKRETLHVS